MIELVEIRLDQRGRVSVIELVEIRLEVSTSSTSGTSGERTRRLRRAGDEQHSARR